MNLLTTTQFDDNHLPEDRTVFDIFGTGEASISNARGLHAFQHRGHETTGIVSFDGKEFHAHRRVGHVGKNFGADSLAFFPIAVLYRTTVDAGSDNDCPQFCDAYFTDGYPIELASGLSAKRVFHGTGR